MERQLQRSLIHHHLSVTGGWNPGPCTLCVMCVLYRVHHSMALERQ